MGSTTFPPPGAHASRWSDPALGGVAAADRSVGVMIEGAARRGFEGWLGAGRVWWDDAIDQLVGSDPGLNRLRMALQGVACIGGAILAEYLFVKGTGALQATAATRADAAAVAAGNHALLVIAMLLGGMVGLITSMSIAEVSVWGQLLSVLIVPVPILASLAFSLALGGHRGLILASFAVLLGLGGLARRWGPRGALLGMPLFIGDLIGFFLHGVVKVGDLGWLAAELGVGVLVCGLVRVTLFFPDPAAALRRSQRAWRARTRSVARSAANDFRAVSSGSERATDETVRDAHLHRQLNRLNEASLIIDAHLVEPGALPVGSSARRLHERLFEAELGLTNAARFAAALRDMDLPDSVRDEVAAALGAVRDGDMASASGGGHRILDRLAETAPFDLTGRGLDTHGPLRRTRVILHRFATSVALFGDAMEELAALGAGARRDGDSAVFVPAVSLRQGWLPGSTDVSATTSASSGAGWQEQISLPPYVRSALQMTIAVAVATVLGDLLSGRRFYWAVIAAFVAFYGVNNTIEQARKALLRVVGTAVGIVIGSLVAGAIGRSVPWGIATILVSLFLGLYLIRVNYGFMVIAVTIMVSQLYEQLDEFSHSLLLLRLGETTIGAAVATAIVLLVLPLRTSRVLDVALSEQLTAVRRLVVDGLATLSTPADSVHLDDQARAVDSAFQTLDITARPLRHLGQAGLRAQRLTVAAGALRHYSRNLAGDIPAAGALPGTAADEGLDVGADLLLSSLDAIISSLAGGPDQRYVRSASAWNIVEQRALETLRLAVESGGSMATDTVAVMLAARDLQMLDGALAQLARLQGMTIEDLDIHTATARP
jgi:hypothetical protein